ncbi:MAG: hypothetical protein KGL95_02805 [Patescibacteria group bacterium]|nr:hypothetical protein [Patescibacteria group bacterium]
MPFKNEKKWVPPGRDKSVGAVANELRCHQSVNEIIRTLEEKIREKKGK